MGWESTIDALSFACHSSCRTDTGQREPQPHDRHRFATSVDRAAEGAEQGGTRICSVASRGPLPSHSRVHELSQPPGVAVSLPLPSLKILGLLPGRAHAA